jgi:hypothetical protein
MRSNALIDSRPLVVGAVAAFVSTAADGGSRTWKDSGLWRRVTQESLRVDV